MKIFDEKTLERLIMINLVLLIIIFIINLAGSVEQIIENKSLKGLPIEGLFSMYLFCVLYLFVCFKIIKK